MADYEAELQIDADPQAVFDYLSDVGNLPKYFERMTSAERGEGHEVHVRADLGDRSVEGDAWFEVDTDAHAISWGSEGPNDYRGRLHVAERGTGSLVTVSLSTARAEGDEIQRGLEETLHNVQALVEP